MTWNWIKSWFKPTGSGRGASPPQVGEVPWVEAMANPWGVPVLNVQPVTRGMLSLSEDKQSAENVMSFQKDDGVGFIGVAPDEAGFTRTSLRFRTDGRLADGALFIPTEMEHKWALYYHRRQILCIRSWTRQVAAVADVEMSGNYADITTISGAFGWDEPGFTARVLDYLLRSHALGLVYPVPLPVGMETQPRTAALWCMSWFGNLALFATPHQFPRTTPEEVLRTDSLLHMAVSRGDVRAAHALLDSGMPIDVLARDGFTPLHWALSRPDTALLKFLIEHGAVVDARSAQGATPLMNAVPARSFEKVAFLLDRGADPNAVDQRGFTALHRAAEMGQLEVVKLLLDRGAAPHPEAQGHTPRSLAQGRGEKAIVELLDRR